MNLLPEFSQLAVIIVFMLLFYVSISLPTTPFCVQQRKKPLKGAKKTPEAFVIGISGNSAASRPPEKVKG